MPTRPKVHKPFPARERAAVVPRTVESKRLTAAQRGYGSRWQKARATYLARHPLCVQCEQEGRTRAARVVDHITPHKGDPILFWDSKGNWQALCKPHHDAKTAREDGGFGNREGGVRG